MQAAILPDRHDYLDSLRGIAILAVVAVHTALLTVQQNGPYWSVAFAGQRGVQLFYIISAFTLCLSLDGRRKEHHPLLNYFLRRFFRIAPLFYVAIFINLAVNRLWPAIDALPPMNVWDVLSGMLFLNGLRPQYINFVAIGGWSIAVETTFYLTLPYIHKHIVSVRQAVAWFVSSAILLGTLSTWLAGRASNTMMNQYFAFLWFPVEFPVFLLGVLCYRIWQRYIRSANITDRPGISWALLLCSFILFGANLPFNDEKLYYSAFLFVPLLLGLSLYPNRIIVNSFTRYIGKISYSLYLLHFFSVMLCFAILQHFRTNHQAFLDRHIYGHLGGWAIAFVAVLLLAIPVCDLSWRLIEAPGIKLGRHLIAVSEGRRQRKSEAVSVTSPDAQV